MGYREVKPGKWVPSTPEAARQFRQQASARGYIELPQIPGVFVHEAGQRIVPGEYTPPPVREDLRDVPKRKQLHPEHDLQAAFVAQLDLMLGQYPELALAYAIPNAVPNRRTAGRLYAEGMRAGPFDWCLPLEHGDFAGLRIEFKRDERERPSPVQQTWGNAMLRARWRCLVHYRADQAVADVLDYLNHPPRYPIDAVRHYCRDLLDARYRQREANRAKRQRKRRP